MKETKRLKGFTLIELIVVMAIFGVLMVAVMQILTPLNKLSKRATIQEANAAAVDNIKNYMESSLRYADAIEVNVGALTDNNGNFFRDTAVYSQTKLNQTYGVKALTGGPQAVTAEEAAVINFLDNHYSNRVEPNTEDKADPATGRVYMLKVDNSTGGVISETVWKFKAGYTYTKFFTDDTEVNGVTYHKGEIMKKVDESGNVVNDIGRVNASLVSKVSSEASVINPVYYEYYSFYIAPGYNNIETVFETDKLSGFDTSDDTSDDYYAAVKPAVTAKGNTYADFSKEMFSLSVVTYKNDKDADDEPLYKGKALLTDEAGNDHTYVAFQSPFALSNMNMSLVNINSAFSQNKGTDNYGPVRYQGPKDGKDYEPGDMVEGDNDHWKYERITSEKAPKIDSRLYVHTANTQAQAKANAAKAAKKTDGLYEDCIYFIYTLPDFR
ncbi:MAG: type II secretion system protein [Ruminococcus sp.]|nr:type II secretion system protein [Ruminococcus sp.]